MAGHFIAAMTASDFIDRPAMGITVTAIEHQGGAAVPHGGGAIFQGWTVATRQVLSTALSGGAIPNRQDLPPHRYLQIAAANPLGDKLRLYLASAGWVDKLTRPACAGLGLRNLTPNAQAAWNAGDKDQALALQIQHGNVSIEVYYVAGYEVN